MRLTMTMLGALVLATHPGCASTPGNASSAPTNVITADAIARMTAGTAYDVLATKLNRLLTRPLRGGSTSFERPQEPMVVIDGVRSELAALRVLPARDIEEIRILGLAEGTLLYGTGATNGVIVIKTASGIHVTIWLRVDPFRYRNQRAGS